MPKDGGCVCQLSDHEPARSSHDVKKHDPEMKRTLGVITKPDLPHPGSDDQRQAVQLASGKDSLNQLPLGWHVLRNRTEFEDTHEEEFFRAGNWSVIQPKDRGAADLRVKQSQVLLAHIKRSLPGLIEDIERSKPEVMRGFFVEIAVQSERLARDGVNGHYGDDFFGELEDPEVKLRYLVRNLNSAFGITLLSKGAAEKIVWSNSNERDFGDRVNNADERFPDPEPVSESVINRRVGEVSSVNQGREFPGSDIARFHLRIVPEYCVRFVERSLVHITGATQKCWTPFCACIKLQELLRPYRTGYVVALKDEMHSRTDTRTLKRLFKQAEKSIGRNNALSETGLLPMDILAGLDSDGRLIDDLFRHREAASNTVVKPAPAAQKPTGSTTDRPMVSSMAPEASHGNSLTNRSDSPARIVSSAAFSRAAEEAVDKGKLKE
ncbi:hypothetical protein NLU13_6110 [Sarocladium strictum]|uniref:Dynamin stalk domain-containing protein n=1 Tax=Sarocladium strictum TaxID=5046 RepID=A0AA39GF99_SARSR|nr:hypothetical protein NLU13_6110 [Sarocladium strictum]